MNEVKSPDQSTVSAPARAAAAHTSRSRASRAERSDRETVPVELTRAQVEQVVRAASGPGSMSILLSRLPEKREALGALHAEQDRRLSSSLLSGLMMLAHLPADGSYLGNSDVADLLKMNESTTHRYITTLAAVGLVEQDPRTRRYRRAP